MEFFSIKGKSAIVTGAARGIGRAIADRFAAAGADVLIADMDLSAAEATAAELTKARSARVRAVKTDITVATDVEKMIATAVEHFGKLDILVNNAGIAGRDNFIWDMPEADFRKVVDVDLTALWLCCKYAVIEMRKRKYGRIVNIASVAGKEGNPKMMAYSAAKAGVIGLTKSLAKETCTDGILVNSVAPAVIETPILEQLTPQQVEYMLAKIPMRRVGKPEEVAALAHFLASDDCSFSTGAVYDISGGRATY